MVCIFCDYFQFPGNTNSIANAFANDISVVAQIFIHVIASEIFFYKYCVCYFYFRQNPLISIIYSPITQARLFENTKYWAEE